MGMKLSKYNLSKDSRHLTKSLAKSTIEVLTKICEERRFGFNKMTRFITLSPSYELQHKSEIPQCDKSSLFCIRISFF